MMNVQEELVVIKGKRTKRPRPQSPLGPITNMPSPTSNSSAGASNTNNNPGGLIDVVTATSTSTTSEYESEDEDMAYCLILLAQGHHHHHHTHKASPSSKHVSASTQHDHNDHNNSLYKCKTCNRCFPSFQALGGHRASHKKPNNKSKGAYGIEETQEGVTTSFVNELDGDHDHHCDPTTTSTILSLQLSSSNSRLNLYRTSSTRSKPSATAKSKLHECSICGAEFSSGQALGGHMRRHRNFLSTSTTTTSMSGGNINIIGSTESPEAKKPRNVLKLDLNLPAAPEGDHQRESKFSFQTKENVIVFSAPSLVDCHY